MELSLGQSVVAAPDVVSRELEGEAVLLNLETGIYFGLDPVGTRVWQLVQAPTPLGAVCDAMEREFDVERAVLERDVLALVERLREKGLVQLAP